MDMGTAASSLWNMGAGLIGSGIVIVILVGLGYYLLKVRKGDFAGFIRYPVQVTIYEKRGDVYKLAHHDKAAALTDKQTGKSYYRLKKAKVDLQAIPYEYLTEDNHLYLFSPNRDEYHPCEFRITDAIKKDVHGQPVLDENGDVLTIPIAQLTPVMDEGAKLHFITRMQKNYERFKNVNPMLQYLPLIGLVLMFMGMLVLLWVYLDKMTPIVNAANAAAVAIENAAYALATNTAPAAPPA